LTAGGSDEGGFEELVEFWLSRAFGVPAALAVVPGPGPRDVDDGLCGRRLGGGPGSPEPEPALARRPLGRPELVHVPERVPGVGEAVAPGDDLAVEADAAGIEVEVGEGPAVAVEARAGLVLEADLLALDQGPEEGGRLAPEALDGPAGMDALGGVDADEADADGASVEFEDDGVAVDDAEDARGGRRCRRRGRGGRRGAGPGADGSPRAGPSTPQSRRMPPARTVQAQAA
jgi:hypothetical protein